MAGRDRTPDPQGNTPGADVRPVAWNKTEAAPQPAPWTNTKPVAPAVSVTSWSVAARVPESPKVAPSKAAPPKVEPPPPPPEEVFDEAPVEPVEPAIPDGMLLVSEEALAEREEAIVEALRKPYLDAATSLVQAIDELETRLTDHVVELAAKIAQALTYREFAADRSLIMEVAQRALRLVGPLERLTVRCAPEDAELLRDNLPALARMEVGRPVEVLVRPSDDIMPGGLLLTFDGGVVDAREERRAARIVEAVKAAIRESGQSKSDELPKTEGA